MLRVFDNGGKTADRYTVVMNDDVFTMSDNADMPNGVNMYAGEIGDQFHINFVDDLYNTEKEIKNLKELPKGVLVSIINRVSTFYV